MTLHGPQAAVGDLVLGAADAEALLTALAASAD